MRTQVAAQPESGTLHPPCWRDEIVGRATAIVVDSEWPSDGVSRSPRLVQRLEQSERHAIEMALTGGGDEAARRMAALEFVTEAVTMLILEDAATPGEVHEIVERVAVALEMSSGAASLAVFVRVLAAKDVLQLPPQLAMAFLMKLMHEFGAADAASLWATGPSGRLECIASAGDAPKSRRQRAAAQAVLRGDELESKCVPAVVIERWDRPFAAVVARGRPEASARITVFLRALASALSPVFEREMLFDRNAAQERMLVSATERRLVRLGFDLHDGPLQELVALADDLRFARDQVTS